MKAKESLEEIRKMEILIEQKKKELSMLHGSRPYIKGFDYSAERVQTSPDGEGFTRGSHRLVDLEMELESDIERFSQKRHEVITRIQSMEKPEHTSILFKRYVEYQSFEQISYEMGYSYNYTCRIHGEALKSYEEKYAAGVKDDSKC